MMHYNASFENISKISTTFFLNVKNFIKPMFFKLRENENARCKTGKFIRVF